MTPSPSDLPLHARVTPLAGDWRLRYGPQALSCLDPRHRGQPGPPAGFDEAPARVPGNAELDLLRAGRLPAPLERGNNIYALRALEGHQWWYDRSFDWDGDLPPGHGIDLVFDGLDCVAAVWLNGQWAGSAQNMLIPHRFAAGHLLRPGANHLAVAFDSAVLAGRGQPLAPGDTAVMPGEWDSLAVRKAPHQFGWDIMPRAVSAGIWRDARLETVPPARWRSVYFATTAADPARNAADVLLDWDFAAPSADLEGWTVVLTLARNGQTRHERVFPALAAHDQRRFRLEPAELWWPRGSGAAVMYDASLALRGREGQTLDLRRWRTGLRTVRLERTDVHAPGRPGRFDFLVNGEKVFIHGSNWVPLDAFHARDPERLGPTLDLAADLNCNMLRCWGGNVYEPDPFFDRCDEEGILVWQDFAYACALYPQTPEFHARAAEEAESVIRRLRNHPSLALWAGNNEIDMFYSFCKPRHDPNIDDRLSREVLPAAVRRHDPERDYLPSSPYHSPACRAAAAKGEGGPPEDHLWGPRDDYLGDFYRTAPARFASEIGYHGCPAVSTLERLMTPGHVWPWRGPDGRPDDEWLTHATRPLPGDPSQDYRIGLMASQVRLLFGSEPDDLGDFVWASQFSQSEANKTFVERFRSDAAVPGGHGGILWWNVRDGWPIISDAVVDWYGRRKLSYFTLRRVQADLCALPEEPAAPGGAHRLWMVNGSRQAASGQFTVACWHGDGRRGEWASARFAVGAGGRAFLAELPPLSCPALYVFRWKPDSGTAWALNHLLAGPRPYALAVCRQWYQDLDLVADA